MWWLLVSIFMVTIGFLTYKYYPIQSSVRTQISSSVPEKRSEAHYMKNFLQAREQGKFLLDGARIEWERRHPGVPMP